VNRRDRLSQGGPDSLQRSTQSGLVDSQVGDRSNPRWLRIAAPVAITGGAGFIGANVAHRLLSLGQQVILFDNLSRPGVRNNLAWLRGLYGDAFSIVVGDIRDYSAVEKVVRNAAAVFHFAAQVSVTSSLSQPREDFMVNAEGTLNLLEALRSQPRRPPLLFTSTNKVYGAMTDMQLSEERLAYVPADDALRERGIAENVALDFHSPYGCSKGCAEQYVLDYSHSFSLPATVFRMSCIYGPLQCGNEDQGWVAHFASAMFRREPITIYGNGKQVRDLLFVDDLIDALFLAVRNIDNTCGRAFNIGGGPSNAHSVLEVISLLSEIEGIAPTVLFSDWRRADQRYYVSDTASFRQVTKWTPRTRIRDGIEQLCGWLKPTANKAISNAGSLAIAR